jgi:Nucleoside-diphosphate-sugar pyrophosphorylase involved in lipopolysaccharide biosynthesis/translation initiation factor 2B, gamma/epsilon subunits (eIF-2Bgamma/eIF-2Bepsilon)
VESSKTFLKKNKLKIFVKHIKNFPKIDVVILAGGRGSRVKKFLQNSSKPMIKFGKKHFLEYIIKKVASYPINQIHIMCGYKGKYIFKKYNKKYQNFVPINCYVEKKPLGTGGAFKLIKRKLTNNFIVINGDTYFDIDYSIFFNQKIANKNFIILSKDLNNKKNFKLNNLNLNKNKKIFFDKNSNYFNGGIYFFNKSIIKKICKIKNKFISLEKDILQKEIKNKKIFGILKKNSYEDIGTEQN